MVIVRVARNVSPYQFSIEGEEEELPDLIKKIDELAGKIDDREAVLSEQSAIGVTVNESHPPAISEAASASEAVTKLFFESEWGTIPRTIRDIKTMLDANALFYPTTSLSGVLIKLARQGRLRRWKTANGYSYVRGRVSS